jgi:hypothetical protein
MSRSILTQKDVSSRPATRDAGASGAQGGGVDDYNARVMKYIPAEVVAVYVFVQGLISQPNSVGSNTTILWVVFAVVLVLTPFYLKQVQHVTKVIQLVVSTVAFAVWVFSIGGPFATLPWYQAIYGAVLLPLFTFAVGIIEPTN